MSEFPIAYPKKVLLREDGPREGFQILKQIIPTEKKLALIKALVETGVTSIEVTSFVRPDRVPQHADAEEVAKGLVKTPGVRYRALYLNQKGLSRAKDCKSLQPEGFIHLAASDSFLKSNSNASIDEVIKQIPGWINAFNGAGLNFERIMLSTAFGEPIEGKKTAQDVLPVIEKALQQIKNAGGTLEEMTLADTTGWANPEDIKKTIGAVRNKWPELIIGLHLHDTRGTGLANAYAGLELGVSRFDCSVAGLGGCPFTKGAAGNIPTEDMAFMCEELGISTGVNLEKYIIAAKLAEEITGMSLPGKLKNAGLLC